ncbi:toprim domain-containing protein [Erythrobacter insulae]|uniref:Toprim domain-containing protein n=1 Tax=Erythrobacter insulae TaxID=2584124 RepID=A0A547P9S2_9SPHN|nr:toprim domain-containing protein [Erythrobacter insulae]TRD10908.1 toprim domain-containing protein [Erythrobacter insulae]
MIDIHAIARFYGGTVCRDNALIPTPGHSSRDRGTAISACPEAPDGALVFCFNGDQTTALAVKAILRDDGFLPTAGRRALSERERQKLKEARFAQAAKRRAIEEAVASKATEQWDKAEPAEQSHPYLLKKRVPPIGVRQQDFDLLVPMLDENFRLWNLQGIAHDGFKRFGVNARTAGLFWPHAIHVANGKPSPGPLVIGEGFATMAAIHDATGFGVVAAMTAHNLAAVAKTMRALFPKRRIILAADDDRHLAENIGMRAAQKAAESIGGLVALPCQKTRQRPQGPILRTLSGARLPNVLQRRGKWGLANGCAKQRTNRLCKGRAWRHGGRNRGGGNRNAGLGATGQD